MKTDNSIERVVKSSVGTDDFKTATGEMAEEYRSMDVGEVKRFPLDRYNYNTLRSNAAVMIKERMEGWKWSVRADYSRGCAYVKRLS